MIYYVRIKRCGRCACGYLASKKENMDDDVTSTPAVVSPSSSTIEKADIRISASIHTIRYLKSVNEE